MLTSSVTSSPRSRTSSNPAWCQGLRHSRCCPVIQWGLEDSSLQLRQISHVKFDGAGVLAPYKTPIFLWNSSQSGVSMRWSPFLLTCSSFEEMSWDILRIFEARRC